MNALTWFCVGAVVGLLAGILGLAYYLGGGGRP
jgi:hypothetical protein